MSDIFPQEFVPNVEGSTYHPKWVKSNPGEAAKWATFRDAAIAHKKDGSLAVPVMATKYGKALVAAGREHMSVIDLGAAPIVPPPPPPPPTGVKWGVNGSKWYDATHNPSLIANNLGARRVRHEEAIATSASTLDTRFFAYRDVGVDVFYQVDIDSGLTTAGAQNLGLVAQRHGPNGSKSITYIELGNENTYSYKTASSAIPAYANNYALRAKEAAISMQGTGVGLVIQGDDGLNNAGWIGYLFAAVPNLKTYIAGWSLHPYGPALGTTLHDGSPAWYTDTRCDRILSQTAAQGDTTTPFFITEYGISTDDGLTLSKNYEWKLNMTYAETITAMSQAEAVWDAKFGSRLVFRSYYRDFDNSVHGATTDIEAYFGIVKYDLSDKGQFSNAMRTRFAS